jgi:carboxyl-terminal processing protease
VRERLFYGIFDFVRHLVAGQITGLREYRINETQHRSRITSEETNRYPVTDELIAAFRQHIASKPQFNLTDDRLTANLAYLRTQMRRELITAAYGPDAGEQTYLPDDAQFRKAIESLDQARMLADNASRARSDRQ